MPVNTGVPLVPEAAMPEVEAALSDLENEFNRGEINEGSLESARGRVVNSLEDSGLSPSDASMQADQVLEDFVGGNPELGDTIRRASSGRKG